MLLVLSGASTGFLYRWPPAGAVTSVLVLSLAEAQQSNSKTPAGGQRYERQSKNRARQALPCESESKLLHSKFLIGDKLP